MNEAMKRRIAFFTVGFGVLGVVLVLLGSAVEVPYTTRETFNNYPYDPPGIWADENFTLGPYSSRYYALDLLNENNSIIYVKIEEATNPILFEITGPLGLGFHNVSDKIIIKQYVPDILWPESPFEYFWTPPILWTWHFIFDNPYNRTTNVTVKIIDYRYNTEWQREVTRYHPPLDESFAYAGIIAMIAAIVPPAYDLYKTRKKPPKEVLWRDEAEKIREDEEAGRLK